MKRLLQIALSVLSFGLLIHTLTAASTLEDMEIKLDEAAVRLDAVAASQQIPPEILSPAEGILILHQVKAGFLIGGKGGEGVLLVRDTLSRRWSAPAFLNVGEGSAGLQIGVETSDTVLVFMTRESLGIIDGSRFQVGVDAGAVAGPRVARTEDDFSETPVFYYHKTGGLYAGATFKGGWIFPDDSANELLYGIQDITVRDIVLNKRVKFPSAGKKLLETIQERSM